MAEVDFNSTVKPIMVLLVCGVRLYRDAITPLLTGEADIRLSGCASPEDEIISTFDAATPDVILLDMGGRDALDTALRLIHARPGARVLGFGVLDLPAHVVACAQAGLAGYVPNSASLNDLVAAARLVAAGGTVCSSAMADSLFQHLRSAAIGLLSPAQETPLTHRQQQIVRLLVDGHSNKEIARRLAISASTVKNHVHEILDRLALSSRNQISSCLHRQSARPPSAAQISLPHAGADGRFQRPLA